MVLAGAVGFWLSRAPSGQPADHAATTAAATTKGPVSARLLIRFAAEADSGRLATRAEAEHALRGLARDIGARLHYSHPTAGLSHVVRLSGVRADADFDTLLRALRGRSEVAHVEVDAVAYRALSPNDELFGDGREILWNLKAPNGSRAGGMNLPTAWDRTRGAGITVAVLDTGIVPHADLDANVLSNGYDFVGADSDGAFRVANDGDGRDADPADPGDWVAAGDLAFPVFTGCTVANSSWHGTAMAGVIAAVGNNSVGLPGVAYESKILPVRVLGKCKGYISDIADAIRWASGAAPAGGATWASLGIPANTTPARVINLSFSTPPMVSPTPATPSCQANLQSAIDAARTAGAVVVAATGNDGAAPATGASSIGAPASCSGVIAVTSHTIEGDRLSIANWGPGTDLSAPATGSCATLTGCLPHGTTGASGTVWREVWSTQNIGVTAPTTSASMVFSQAGTSVSAAHTSGAAALLLSAMPSLNPDGVESILKASTRAFPVNSYCWTFEVGTLNCGLGLLDATDAMTRLTALTPAVTASTSAAVATAGSTVTLTGAATPGSAGSESALTYSWQQLSGPVVTVTGSTSKVATFTAPSPGGAMSFRFTASDATGASASATVNLRANTAPTVNAIPAQSARAGAALTFTATGTDAESDALTFAATGLPSGATLSSGGVFNWPISAAGTYSVAITASDGFLTSAPRTVTITVAPNTAPTVNEIAARTVRAGEPVTFTATGADAESDTLTFAATGLPTGATFSAAGAFNWSPATPAGTYTVSITASDGLLTSAARAVTITVRANTAPTIAAVPNQTSRAGQSLSFNVTSTDAESDPITLSATGLPPNASFSVAAGEGGGIFLWPSPVAGNYTVTLNASDGVLTTSRAVAITVTANTAPTVNAIPAQSVRAGAALTFTATGADAENDALTFTATGLPTGATLSSAGVFNWTNATPAGTYTVSITASDGLLTSAARAVSITVRANTAPTVTQVGSFTVRLSETVTLKVAGTDPENDAITFTASGLPSGASLSASGDFSWPGATPGGSYPITVTASDGLLTSAPMSFTITVTSRTTDPGGGGSMDLAGLALLGLWGLARARRRALRPVRTRR